MLIDDLSKTQQLVLKAVAAAPNGRQQIAGHRNAPYLSAARALVRKGLLSNALETGCFFISRAGYELLKKR